MTKIQSYQFDEIIIKVYKDKFKDINLAKLWLNVANYTFKDNNQKSEIIIIAQKTNWKVSVSTLTNLLSPFWRKRGNISNNWIFSIQITKKSWSTLFLLYTLKQSVNNNKAIVDIAVYYWEGFSQLFYVIAVLNIYTVLWNITLTHWPSEMMLINNWVNYNENKWHWLLTAK